MRHGLGQCGGCAQVRGRLMKSESNLHAVRQDCFQEECEGARLQRELADQVKGVRSGRLGQVYSLQSRLEASRSPHSAPRRHGLPVSQPHGRAGVRGPSQCQCHENGTQRAECP